MMPMVRNILLLGILPYLCSCSLWNLEVTIRKPSCSSMTKIVLIRDNHEILAGKSDTNSFNATLEFVSNDIFEGVLYVKNNCIGKEKLFLEFPIEHQYTRKIPIGDYHIDLRLLKATVETVDLIYKSDCSCEHKRCSCCEILEYPKFRHSVCVNITYNAETIGIEASIGIDGFYFTKSISARNPPPICFAIPSLHDVASVCVAFTDLDISHKYLTGCTYLEAELIHFEVLKKKIGCFKMPI